MMIMNPIFYCLLCLCTYVLSDDPPLYILEPIIERNSLGGGRTFKINAVTGELVEAIFTE